MNLNVVESKYFFWQIEFRSKFYSLDFENEKDTLLLYLRAFVPKSFYPVRNALLDILVSNRVKNSSNGVCSG
jgi:hypothetical protein